MDPIPFIYSLFLVLVAIGVLTAIRARRQGREEVVEAELQEAVAVEKEEVKAVEEVQDFARLWEELRERFPFMPEPVTKGLGRREIRDAMLGALHQRQGIGSFDFGGVELATPELPTKERLRHLYLAGREETGRGAYLDHLVRMDLAEGRGVAVIGSGERLFRERLLPLVPDGRADDVVYFAPADPENTLTLNPLEVLPDEDSARVADDLAKAIETAVSEDQPEAERGPARRSLLGGLVGRRGATLADLPVFDRLEGLLSPEVRQTLCQRESSFSIREALAEGRILLLDLAGLEGAARTLLGRMLLSRLQLELLRRDESGSYYRAFHLYADEFHDYSSPERTWWRELLERGREYGLAVTLSQSSPADLPEEVRQEIFAGVNSMAVFALDRAGAELVAPHLQTDRGRKGEQRLGTVPAASIEGLSMGEAWARFAGGLAVALHTPPPAPRHGSRRVEELVRRSRERYGAAPQPT